MDISILVAAARNGVIGKDNQLLWRLSDDLKLFKKRTLGHVIIMGRKTFDSIGKALPGRTNIVITRNKTFTAENVTVAHSLEEAVELGGRLSEKEEIFIIGGDNIYRQSAEIATKLYFTDVDAEVEGDAFFDISPYSNWRIVGRDNFAKSDKNEYNFTISEYVK